MIDAVAGESEFLGVDPLAVAAIDDATLADLANRVIDEGLYPEPGFYGDPYSYSTENPDSLGTINLGLEGTDPMSIEDAQDLDLGIEDFHDDWYEGCPQELRRKPERSDVRPVNAANATCPTLCTADQGTAACASQS